ncbi:retrovirus-related pol polyprotein from transposon TNT 1-94 [Tanacetum coccineum]
MKTSPYYSSESPYVIPTTDHPSPSSPRSPISFPSSVSHLSPTSHLSKSSKCQPTPAVVDYIDRNHHHHTLVTRKCPVNLRQHPKQHVPPTIFCKSLLPVLPTTITEAKPRLALPNSFGVAMGYTGIDFHETFSPVVKSTTIRAVLSLAITNNWPLRQLDIQKCISLYGNLSNNKGTIDNIICQLGSAFSLKDLGPLNYFLGIEIVPHVSGILLSQKKYILELLQSVGLSNCNPVSSPMLTSSSLSLDDTFAVNKVCQYMHASTEHHWSIVERILCYLHGMVEHGMLIRRSFGSTLQAFTDVLWKGNPDTSLKAFSDANWARDSDDQRSMAGFAIYLGLNLISWTTHKQRTVSRSSTEAEYKAFADTVAELTWLQALLNELGIHSSSTPILWCDNLGATYLSANPIFHARTKHVEIYYHFVREKVAQGDL